MFRLKHSTVFSSTMLLEAEDRLLDRAHTLTGPTVGVEVVEKITGKPDVEGRVVGRIRRRRWRRSSSPAASSMSSSARPGGEYHMLGLTPVY